MMIFTASTDASVISMRVENRSLSIVLILLLATNFACGQEKPSGPSMPTRNSIFARDEVDDAVDRGIDFLLSKQRDDGAVTDRSYATSMTALSVMALASVGTTVGESTPRGRAMQRALDYVLRDDVRDAQGYFGKKDDSRMYGHGIVTLMLTEMLGMGSDDIQDAKIQRACRDGIDLILRSQQISKTPLHRGGWRYQPDSLDSDLSVSVWQLMALRSAKNDGMDVPSVAIEDAVEYLERSFTTPLDRQGKPTEPLGGFSYTANQKNPTYTMTSAGLLALQVCGRYESPLVVSASDWLMANPPKWGDRFFFYGTYYYAQGMHQRGNQYAKKAEELVQKILLDKQQDNGSWVAQGGRNRGRETSIQQVWLS